MRRWVLVAVLCLVPATAHANPGPYHWPSRVQERTLRVAFNTTTWPIAYALGQWNESPYINLVKVEVADPCKTKKIVEIQVCLRPATSGWLGQAAVFHIEEHITWAYVELNASKTWTWRKKQYVLCHELGHAIGLLHRPETADDSCMVSDYWKVIATPRADTRDLQDAGSMYAGHVD